MTAKAGAAQARPCPCGGLDYAHCCQPYHLAAGAVPATAERLMRARYSAYALGLWDFVHATWHARTRPALADLRGEGGVKWLGLEVRRHVAQDDTATVEFVARYKIDGRAHRLHEVSRFVREAGRWFYLDGSFPERQTTT